MAVHVLVLHELVHVLDVEVQDRAVGHVVEVQVDLVDAVQGVLDEGDLVERRQDSHEEQVRQEVPEVVLAEDRRDPVVLVLPGLLTYLIGVPGTVTTLLLRSC